MCFRTGRSAGGRPEPGGGEAEVLLLVVDAGGGHRSAARALLAAAQERGAPFRFRVESLESLLGSLDFLRRRTGLSFEDGYNLILRRRWTVLLVPLLRVLHALIAVRPVVPNFNGVVRDALRAEHPGVPLLVLLTDFADFPPRFWIEPGLTRVLVGTDEAAAQARAIGIPPERVSRLSGMVLHPRFYRTSGPEARARVRRELGFPGEALTVMLLFGGQGSPEIEPLAARLLEADSGWRVIAACGDNPGLVAKLSAIAGKAGGRLFPVGFTDRVADFMAASDLLIT